MVPEDCAPAWLPYFGGAQAAQAEPENDCWILGPNCWPTQLTRTASVKAPEEALLHRHKPTDEPFSRQTAAQNGRQGGHIGCVVESQLVPLITTTVTEWVERQTCGTTWETGGANVSARATSTLQQGLGRGGGGGWRWGGRVKGERKLLLQERLGIHNYDGSRPASVSPGKILL